jgi:eukaryotic-like serine/threonine-protein kinase
MRTPGQTEGFPRRLAGREISSLAPPNLHTAAVLRVFTGSVAGWSRVHQNAEIPQLHRNPDPTMSELSKESAPPPPPERTLYLPGEIIDGKYRLVRPHGEGGMGTVWIAHNVVLDVQVAIKLIRLDDRSSSQRMTERLLHEARAAARLGHPAIVRVFDFGVTRHGDPFVVMEFLHGETLADLIGRESRLSAIHAVQILLPIADALAAAHAKGIVHRDVKPENIFVARDESERKQPKLLDFGIASFVESGNKLTLAGVVLGTPDYMSPEQARGETHADHRTDVWSFCVVLYELLTGSVPFNGINYNALLRSIINDTPPSTVNHAAGDQQLWNIIERGLRKDANERWDTMRVLGEALALWLYERGVREDACAASLKTAWLESGLSGITIEVGSDPRLLSAQDRATPPAPAPAQNEDQEALVVAPSPAPKEPRSLRRALLLAASLAVIVAALIAGALSMRTSEPPTSFEAQAAPASPPIESIAHPAPESSSRLGAAAVASPPAASATPEFEGSSRRSAGSAPRAKSNPRATPPAAAAKSPEPAEQTEPSRKAAGKKDYDFGF